MGAPDNKGITMAQNSELAEMFSRMADVMQLVGENAFKAIAFHKVARKLEELDFDAVAAAKKGQLPQIEGMGASSRRIIEQLANEGKSEDYELLIKRVPAGVLEMLRIPGLGPKTVAQLWKEANVLSVEGLEKAIEQGRLTGLKGLGEKKIAGIVDGLRLLKAGTQRKGFMDVWPVVEAQLADLRSDPRVGVVEVAGSFRRRRQTVGDIDLICWTHRPGDAEAVLKSFSERKEVDKVLQAGGTKASVLVKGGLQVDLRVVPKASFGSAKMYFTGSKDHNVKLRGLAQEKGMTLNEWGLYRIADYDRAAKKPGEPPIAKSLAGAEEEQVYRTLGLEYVEPEIREDRGEVELAAKGKLPELITLADIRGDFHCHTRASDGIATIQQMAEAAKALGYQYVAITDHSKSSVIANGLDEARLRAHIEQIRQVNVPGITILAGSEVDIMVDGRLDYDAALLKELDLVIASPHASLKQDPAKATQRLLRAIDTPYVNIIGHPTGRMINQREGLHLDMGKLFEAAAKSGTAMEINAGWPRWDLDDLNARAAAEAGVTIAINTDAHAPEQFGGMQMGIWVARRAWLTKHNVLNCWSLEKVKQFLARKK